MEKSNYLIGSFIFLVVFTVSFVLEYVTYTFVKEYILPDGYFPWDSSTALRIYAAYSCFLLVEGLLIFKLRRYIAGNKYIFLLVIYFIWLSIPVGTYWHIDITESAWPDALREPLFMVVPQVLTLESWLLFYPGCGKHECGWLTKLNFQDTLLHVGNLQLYMIILSNTMFFYCLRYMKSNGYIYDQHLRLNNRMLLGSFYMWLFLFTLCTSIIWAISFRAEIRSYF